MTERAGLNEPMRIALLMCCLLTGGCAGTQRPQADATATPATPALVHESPAPVEPAVPVPPVTPETVVEPPVPVAPPPTTSPPVLEAPKPAVATVAPAPVTPVRPAQPAQPPSAPRPALTTAPAITTPPAPPVATRSPPAVVAPAPVTPIVPRSNAAQALQPAAAPLDLKSLETRLRQTKAIGVLTKLSLKNQVDDLLARFRAYHKRQAAPSLAELRRSYDMLLLKALSLLQDGDPPLARDIVKSRAAIWSILEDPRKFTESNLMAGATS